MGKGLECSKECDTELVEEVYQLCHIRGGTSFLYHFKEQPLVPDHVEGFLHHCP